METPPPSEQPKPILDTLKSKVENTPLFRIGRDLSINLHLKKIGIENPTKALGFIHWLEKQPEYQNNSDNPPRFHRYSKEYDPLIKACSQQENPIEFFQQLTRYVDTTDIPRLGYLVDALAHEPNLPQVLKQLGKIKHPMERFHSSSYYQTYDAIFNTYKLQQYQHADGDCLFLQWCQHPELIDDTVIDTVNQVQTELYSSIRSLTDKPNLPILAYHLIPDIGELSKQPQLLALTTQQCARSTYGYRDSLIYSWEKSKHDISYSLLHYPELLPLFEKGYNIDGWIPPYTSPNEDDFHSTRLKLQLLLADPKVNENLPIMLKHGLRPELQTNYSEEDPNIHTFWRKYDSETLDQILTVHELIGKRLSYFPERFNILNPSMVDISNYIEILSNSNIPFPDLCKTLSFIASFDFAPWLNLLSRHDLITKHISELVLELDRSDYKSFITSLCGSNPDKFQQRYATLTDPKTAEALTHPNFDTVFNLIKKMGALFTYYPNFNTPAFELLDVLPQITSYLDHPELLEQKIEQVPHLSLVQSKSCYEVFDFLHHHDPNLIESSILYLNTIDDTPKPLKSISSIIKLQQTIPNNQAALDQYINFTDRILDNSYTWKTINFINEYQDDLITYDEFIRFSSLFPQNHGFWDFWHMPIPDDQRYLIFSALIKSPKTQDLFSRITLSSEKADSQWIMVQNILHGIAADSVDVENNFDKYFIETPSTDLKGNPTIDIQPTSQFISFLEAHQLYSDIPAVLTPDLINQLSSNEFDRHFYTAIKQENFPNAILTFLYTHKNNFTQFIDADFYPTSALFDQGWQRSHADKWHKYLLHKIKQSTNSDLAPNPNLVAYVNQVLATHSSYEHSPEIYQLFIKSNEIARQQLEALKEESYSDQWDAVIPDRIIFWHDNLETFVNCHLAHLPIKDFHQFRAMINNPETADILKSLSPLQLSQLQTTINLNLDNIYYTSKQTLNQILQELDSNTHVLKFYKRLLGSTPSSFVSSIQALHQPKHLSRIANYLSDPSFVERFFQAIAEFKNMTSTLIDGYILESDPIRRQQFKETVNQLKPAIYRNKPILPLIVDEVSQELVVDTICLSFPGTDPLTVKQELYQAGDHCDDLARFTIQDQGYQGKIVSAEKEVIVRPGQKLNERSLGIIKTIFAKDQEQDYIAKGGDASFAIDGWKRILTDSGAVNQAQWFETNLLNIIAFARISLGDKIDLFTQKLSLDTSQVSNANDVVAKAQELFGIYYKDNAADAIRLFLDKHPPETSKLTGKLKPERLDQLEQNFGGLTSAQDKQELSDIVNKLKQESSEQHVTNESLGHLLAFITEQRFFAGKKGLRELVKIEKNKFTLQTKTGAILDPSLILTGYVTKNAASYFAKTTAGVCTAHDLTLYHRPDHFHINLVNNLGIIVGNIQGYAFEYQGKPALLFRGFNPSSSLASNANADILCEQMVDMVKQFAQDNAISDVFIPEQGSWHALSNRVGQGVVEYFQSRYLKPENAVSQSYSITDKVIVDTLYRLDFT